MDFLIVGAGLTGAVIARELACKGHNITLIDQRDHIAGNCHTQRDTHTGIMEHKYGPHIFHTDDEAIWQYINQFDQFNPYVNRVKAEFQGQVYSLPINLHTINQFFKKNFHPREAKEWIEHLAVQFSLQPKNFEEQALSLIGSELYQAFLKGYIQKQWGCHPSELPKTILKRLPIRFNYNDNYFSHTFQGIPLHGYTHVVNNIIQHPNISLKLNTVYKNSLTQTTQHIIWTGQLDQWFNFKLGRLKYRSLRFEKETADGDFQGTAVMNYSDEHIPYTRISEHKHFTPWENFTQTIYFKEYSKECGPEDIPYYPVHLAHSDEMLNKYLELAKTEKNVTFAGRLGTYRYMDMDVCIKEAILLSQHILCALEDKTAIKSMYHF